MEQDTRPLLKDKEVEDWAHNKPFMLKLVMVTLEAVPFLFWIWGW